MYQIIFHIKHFRQFKNLILKSKRKVFFIDHLINLEIKYDGQ